MQPHKRARFYSTPLSKFLDPPLRQSVLPLSYQGSSAGWAQISHLIVHLMNRLTINSCSMKEKAGVMKPPKTPNTKTNIYIYICTCFNEYNEKEGRKKQTRQSNIAHPRQSLFLRKMSCLRWDSNPRHSTL